MAKRRKAKRRTASSRKKASRKKSTPRLPKKSSSSEDKSNMWVALILAVVAVVGLVLLYHNAASSGAAVVEGVDYRNPGGYNPEQQLGWELGGPVADRYDGVTEAREFCSYGCQSVCDRTVRQAGTDQRRCYKSCQDRCTLDVNRDWFGFNAN